MTIAVNTKLPPGEYPEGTHGFIYECFSRLAKKYPQHHFIYIFDKAFDVRLLTAKNIKVVVVGPEANRPLIWQYWYNYKLPAILRKHKVDVFFSADGICSLRTKTPQCLLIPPFVFSEQTHFFAKGYPVYYKKNTPKFLTKAKQIVTLSSFSKAALVKKYNTDKNKIEVVYDAGRAVFSPRTPAQKNIIREKYTAGKEYFLFTGHLTPQNNLLNLLKAFSFFKKRQKSNMQLLIAANTYKNDPVFSESLKTFKFRNDVLVLKGLTVDELADITAAAYVFVYPVLFEGFTFAPFEAMQCEVPVICSDTGTFNEYCGHAALYTNPADFNDMAEKMMQLYKDEKKRSELIKEGALQAQKYNWKQTTESLWHALSKTIEKESA